MQRLGSARIGLTAVLLALGGHLPPAGAQAETASRDLASEPPGGQRWAVVAGVNQYTELKDLDFCVADARKLRDRLVDAGFPAENVFLLVDGAPRQVDQPFRANIQRRIESVLAMAEQDDVVVVSFSGHGVHLDGASYFCPTEASLDSPETTMISLESIYRQLESSAARQKLLLVDACRDDPRPPGRRDATAHQKSLEGLVQQLQTVPEGILALSSSAPGQISWEDAQLGHGVFLYYVMEGLAGKADEEGNRDGQVSLLELYGYANLQTRRWVLHNRPGYVQTPELLGKITGDWVIGGREAPRRAPPFAVAPFDERQAREHQQAWAAHVEQPVEMTNSIGMRLVLIPAGESLMGSSDSEEGRDRDESPRHQVRITQPFYLGKHEVTQGQYAAVTGSNPSQFKGANRPAENVSWDEAAEFCEKLSAREGRKYRLPTEAEWEYACRAGTTTAYSFGETSAELDRFGWFLDNTRDRGEECTQEVGLKLPNAFGLHDMHGNVWEWCRDERDTSDTQPYRGGSWMYPAALCRATAQGHYERDEAYNDLGFRVVLLKPGP